MPPFCGLSSHTYVHTLCCNNFTSRFYSIEAQPTLKKTHTSPFTVAFLRRKKISNSKCPAKGGGFKNLSAISNKMPCYSNTHDYNMSIKASCWIFCKMWFYFCGKIMYVHEQKNLEEYVPNEKGMGTFLNCLNFLHMLPIFPVLCWEYFTYIALLK